MTNSERASYIRGLMDGLELDPGTKETKVLNAIVDLLEDLCLSMDELEDDVSKIWAIWKKISTIWTMTSAAVAAIIITTRMTSTTQSLR